MVKRRNFFRFQSRIVSVTREDIFIAIEAILGIQIFNPVSCRQTLYRKKAQSPTFSGRDVENHLLSFDFIIDFNDL